MYTWAKLVQRTEEIYEEVLSKAARQPTDRLRVIVSQNRESFNMLALVVLISLAVLFILEAVRPRANLSRRVGYIGQRRSVVGLQQLAPEAVGDVEHAGSD